VIASGSENLLLDRVWIHDTTMPAVVVEGTIGPSSLAMSGSLVERTTQAGLSISGAQASVDTSAIRDIAADSTGRFGQGISVQPLCRVEGGTLDCDLQARSAVTVQRSHIERSHSAGVAVNGSDIAIEASVIAATRPEPVAQKIGAGIFIDNACANFAPGSGCGTAGRGNAQISHTLVTSNHKAEIVVSGSDAELVSVLVRDTQPQALDQAQGTGRLAAWSRDRRSARLCAERLGIGV
jgi:hypothetical protein